MRFKLTPRPAAIQKLSEPADQHHCVPEGFAVAIARESYRAALCLDLLDPRAGFEPARLTAGCGLVSSSRDFLPVAKGAEAGSRQLIDYFGQNRRGLLGATANKYMI